MAAPRRPVTLRDFLEFGCDSSSDGFRSYPRRPALVPDADADAVRHLQQQQASPVPQAEPSAQLLRRSPSSRSPSSLSLSLFSLPGSSSGSGPGALARISSLSRSFSRRIKEGFWRRRDDDEEAAYFDDRDSCCFPSPLVSSCCSASVSDESEADVTTTTTTTTEETPASERDKATASTSSSSSSSSSSADHDRTDAAADDGTKMQVEADGSSAVGRKKLMGPIMVEDKQQLSPVSALDFPFDDDDGEEGSDAGTCSSPVFRFQRCTPLADLHRTKQQAQLLHKICRYDGAGVAQGIDPVDLDARFTAATSGSESGESADASTRLATTTSDSSTDSSSSADTTLPRHDDDDNEAEHQSADHSPSPHHKAEQEPDPDDEYRLLARLLEHDAAAAACLDDEVSRVLVLDFFAEGADRLVVRSAGGRRPQGDDRSGAAAEALVCAAAEWLRGAGPRWGIGDVVLSGKAALDDMERSRRWMCVGEEERDVGADVEGAVVDALLDELVTELAVR